MDLVKKFYDQMAWFASLGVERQDSILPYKRPHAAVDVFFSNNSVLLIELWKRIESRLLNEGYVINVANGKCEDDNCYFMVMNGKCAVIINPKLSKAYVRCWVDPECGHGHCNESSATRYYLSDPNCFHAVCWFVLNNIDFERNPYDRQIMYDRQKTKRV